MNAPRSTTELRSLLQASLDAEDAELLSDIRDDVIDALELAELICWRHRDPAESLMVETADRVRKAVAA